jgi:group I intron endonuclease
MKSGVYRIKNLINGKFYIGSSSVLGKRFYEHKRTLRGNFHANQHLQSAWNKYGEDSFIFDILEYCDKELLLEREQHYVDTMSPEYNIHKISVFSPLGMKRTKESREKMSLAARGRKMSEAAKNKISEAMKGRVFTKEWREKISKSKLGNTAGLGKKCSDDKKRKISEANKGNKHNVGRIFSDETKRKISEGLRIYNKNKKEENIEHP